MESNSKEHSQLRMLSTWIRWRREHLSIHDSRWDGGVEELEEQDPHMQRHWCAMSFEYRVLRTLGCLSGVGEETLAKMVE